MRLPELPPAWRHFEVTLQLTLVDGRDGREQRLPAARPGATLALPIGRYAASVIVARPLVTGPAAEGTWLLNLERLDREITARAAGDPWSLNREAILAALAADAMSSAAIRPLPERGADLQLPAGRWVWWNPFTPPLLSDGRSPLTLAVPGGYHLLLGDDGQALALQANGDGVLISAAAPKFDR